MAREKIVLPPEAFGKPLVSIAHEALTATATEGSLAIDATCGNGRDTAVLAKAVGPRGRVLAVDIQSRALEITRQLLYREGHLSRVRFKRGCHSRLEEWLASEKLPLSAVAFNLGYLPHGDREIITRTETTLLALNATWKHLQPEGLLSVLAYRGHEGGEAEAQAVAQWIKERVESGEARENRHEGIPGKHPAPTLYLVYRRG